MAIIEASCTANVSVTFADARDTTNLLVIRDEGVDFRDAFFKYDISAISSEGSIKSAFWKVYVNQAMVAHDTETVSRPDVDWTEGNASWASNKTALTTIDMTSTGWKSLDITQTVKNWVDTTWDNYGLRVTPQDLNDAVYGKFDHRAGTFPSLIEITTKSAPGFSGISPWIFMKDAWEKHDKIWTPKILAPKGI